MSASVAAILELKYPQIFVSVAYLAISSISYIFSYSCDYMVFLPECSCSLSQLTADLYMGTRSVFRIDLSTFHSTGSDSQFP